MRSIGHLLTTTGIALLLGALILGFIPINVGDADGFLGDGVACGSALIVEDDLTDYGHELCELQGGGANRRLQTFAMFAMGFVFLVGGSAARAEDKSREVPPPPKN